MNTCLKHPSKVPAYFTGQAALWIPGNSNSCYKLFWRIRNGTFNEVDCTGRNQLYHDRSKIVEEDFMSQLGTNSLKYLVNYKCVFIILDLCERVSGTMMLDILMGDLGLGKVSL